MTTDQDIIVAPSKVTTDGFCEVCNINEYRYKKQSKLVCKWCHDRLESPHLAEKSDQELDEMRNDNLKKLMDATRNSIVNVTNISGIGFK